MIGLNIRVKRRGMPLANLVEGIAGVDGSLQLMLRNKNVASPVTRGQTNTLAEIALWNEFGAPNRKDRAGDPNPLPARPVISKTLRSQRDFIRRSARARARMGKKKNARLSVSILMERLGAKIVEAIRREYLVLKTPTNKPATVKKKDFNNPLVWTGLLARSWFARWIPAPLPKSIVQKAKGLDRDMGKIPSSKRRR